MGMWATRLRILVVVLAVTSLAVGAAPTDAAPVAGETECIGAPAAMVVRGVLVVPAEQTCELVRTIVIGDVRIEAGAEVRTDRAQIMGKVQVGDLANAIFLDTRVMGTVEARGGLNLVVSGGTLGSVRAEDTHRVDLQGATFTGDIEVVGGTVFPSVVGDDLHVKGSIRTRDTTRSNVFASQVNGDLTVERARAGAVLCGSSVRGNATFASNAWRLAIGGGPFACDGNEVGGTLTVHQNEGGTMIPNPITIANNIVGRDLDCTGNAPPPTGGNNQVEGNKEGQCSGL